MIFFVGGVLGAEIAPTHALATLPAAFVVIGTALTTIPAALWMRRWGRRIGYMLGAGVGLLGALLAALGVFESSFLTFCAASLLMGSSGAFIQQYRFGAAESVPAVRSGQAVSYVLLGGIAAGFLGPEIAERTGDLLPRGEFSASFLIMAAVMLGVILLLSFLDEITVKDTSEITPGRPLRQVVLQPAFLIALSAGAVAYGVMSFIMTATPVEMHTLRGFSLSETAWVIQSHLIAMYVPSLFTGFLLSRLGLRRVMLIGVLCLTACVGLGILSHSLLTYWGALVLLGVGWNFLYVGATLLLTQSYRPAERFKAQAINEFTIFGIQAITSLSAGTMLFQSNWNTLLLINLPALATILVLIGVNRNRLVLAAAD